jgi:hypothetical protein
VRETVVTYNGVTISKVETEAIQSDVQYGADGVMPIALKRTATFSGVITTTDETPFVQGVTQLRTQLLRPRGILLIRFRDGNDYTALETVSPTGSDAADADVGIGPLPLSVVITNIAGGRCAHVRFTVTWTRAYSETNAPAILSHRWEQRFTVDVANYTTRVVRGSLVLSQTATLDDLVDPDSYRLHVLPAPVRGFQRSQADFSVSSDGRTLVYEVVDRERFRPPPAPAMEGDGTYAETVQGGILSKSFAIRLVGSKYTHPADIVLAAYSAMRTRIDFANEQILAVSVEYGLFENSVRLSAQSVGVKPVGVQLLTDGFMAFTALSSSDATQEFVQPTAYGAALVKAAAQMLFYPDTDGDSAWDELAKASVVRADSIPGAADSPDTPNVPAQTLTVRAAAINPDIAADIVSGIGTSVVGDDQRTPEPYFSVSQAFTVPVENNMLVLRPLGDGDQEVHQYGSPDVVERHEGEITRLGTPPELPQVRDLVYSGESTRRGVVLRWGWTGASPEPAASGVKKIYKARYWYELAVLDRPSIAGGVGAYPFDDLEITGFGTFRIYEGETKYPESPMLAGFGSGDQQDAQTIPSSWKA